MKRTHSWNKGVLLLSRFAGALLLAAFAVSCKQNVDTPKMETFSVTFSTNAKEYGTLTATLDDRPFTGGNVAAGKTVTFMAQANAGYEVERWTVNGTAVANSTTASYSHKVTAKADVKVFFKAAGNTKYTVRHLQEGLDGTYTKDEEEPKTGTTGKNTAATAKTYTGFITPATVAQKPIAADGSTVIEIKYARKEITLTFNLAGGNIDGKTDSVTGKGKYEEAVTKPVNPKKDGYVFSSWNPKLPETFPAENETYTAQWARLHFVTFTVEGTPPNGTLTATLDGKPFTNGDVAEGKTVEFTASPSSSNYGVKTWTIFGSSFIDGTGLEGSTTARVKITANTHVTVGFIPLPGKYIPVPFGENGTGLKNHLYNGGNAASDDIYYIEVTGLTTSDVKGVDGSNPSPLGKIIRDNQYRKIALKLGAIHGLTDMSCCFSGCTRLTQAPEIPNSVTNISWCFYNCVCLEQAPEIPNSVTDMSSCFSGCTRLTQAPVIPNSVTKMSKCFYNCESLTSVTLKCNFPSSNDSWKFSSAFYNCSKLGANSIKVPADQLQTYKDNAYNMGIWWTGVFVADN